MSYQQTMEVVQLDLGDPDACLKFTEGFSKSNHVDILVNNGGISQRDEFVNSDFCIATRLMNVNTLSTIALTKGFLPQLIELKDKGGAQIVNITSIAGQVGTAMRSFYCMSKFA